MAGVAVLHPQDSFNNRHENFQTIMMNPTHMNHVSPSPNFTNRRQPPPKRVVRKKGRSTEVVDREIKSNQMKSKATEFFAGFAFVDSPPPSSVPLPGFFMKNTVAARSDPTADLRRILGFASNSVHLSRLI
ncbi:hypothetical protein LXL04_005338 [Taraxacum kok-saghyz]